MKKRFLRSDWMRHSRLGKNRKKLQKWRKPRGMHSKIRKKRVGYPSFPAVGYRTPRNDACKVRGLVPVLVHNVRELENAGRGSGVIIAGVGAKKKIEIMKTANEKGIKVLNAGGKNEA